MTDISGSKTVSDGYNKPYTPTTEDVSRRYMFGCWQEYEDTSGDYRAEFDRWFAEVIRKAKSEAWEEGETDGEWNYQNQYRIARGGIEGITNPYRQGETE